MSLKCSSRNLIRAGISQRNEGSYRAVDVVSFKRRRGLDPKPFIPPTSRNNMKNDMIKTKWLEANKISY